jgi:hypothetical protein
MRWSWSLAAQVFAQLLQFHLETAEFMAQLVIWSGSNPVQALLDVIQSPDQFFLIALVLDVNHRWERNTPHGNQYDTQQRRNCTLCSSHSLEPLLGPRRLLMQNASLSVRGYMVTRD